MKTSGSWPLALKYDLLCISSVCIQPIMYMDGGSIRVITNVCSAVENALCESLEESKRVLNSSERLAVQNVSLSISSVLSHHCCGCRCCLHNISLVLSCPYSLRAYLRIAYFFNAEFWIPAGFSGRSHY